MEPEIRYITADEREMDLLLAGELAGAISLNVDRCIGPRPLSQGQTGVIVIEEGLDRVVRPVALIAQDENLRRLFGRYAQLRTDLSPITSWCHVLTPSLGDGIYDGVTRSADYRGTEAAWTGLIVAEAILLGERPLSSIRVSSCFASQTFAVARSKGLWGNLSRDTVLKRFDEANRLCRGESTSHRNQARMLTVRASLQPMWASLASIVDGASSVSKDAAIRPLVDALKALALARAQKTGSESRAFVEPLVCLVPESTMFASLEDASPEERLQLFDRLIDTLKRSDEASTILQRQAVALLAGYLATVVAGGSPSLALVERHADRWPELMAWAYLVGGIGEKIVWTSSFDGLGRLVARELGRPFRLDEPPTCDFGYDEAAVLADPKLSDSLVHLRIKQARILSVSILPGVNISIPIADGAVGAIKPETARAGRPIESASLDEASPWAALADSLWPYLRGRMIESMRLKDSLETARNRTKDSAGPRSKKRKSSSQLPLRGSR